MAGINEIFGQFQQAPSIYDEYVKGRESRQQRQQSEQVIAQNEQTLQAGEREASTDQDKAYVSAIAATAAIAKSSPPEVWGSLLRNRRQKFEEQGFSTDGIDQAIQMVDSGDMEGAKALIEQYSSINIPGSRKVQSSSFIDIKNDKGETMPGQAVTYSDGTSEVVPLTVGEGFTIPKQETKQEERLAKFLDFQERKRFETSQAKENARNTAIGAGDGKEMVDAKGNIFAAHSDLRKSEHLMRLMDQIETGGINNRVLDSMQSFFGVRPATEEEANNLMQSQVLSMLGSFEGAISEGERNFIEKMVPSWGTSIAGNKRILANAMELSKIRISRGEAAMGGKDSYDTYLKGLVTGTRATEKTVLKQFSEDQIAKVMKKRGMTREQVIQGLSKELDDEQTQKGK